MAEAQGGHIERGQLRALGLTPSAIAHLVRRGLLIRVHQGVYAVGHRPRQPLDRAHGVLLAVGERSALGHRSAGSYWEIFATWQFPLEVVTPLKRRPSAIIVHHCTTLTRADIHAVDGLRVTSAARTALDLTPRLNDARATRMVNDLRIRRKLTRGQLRSVIKRNPHHPGTRRLTQILAGSQREPTRSELEDAYLRIIVAAGLPLPEVNVHVHGHRVDFYYREQRLIVEVDGYSAHSHPRQFAADRRRDREILIATGIATIRFTYDDCIDTPEAVAATVRAALHRTP